MTINNKGEVRVGTLLVGIVVFLVFLTSGLFVIGDFFAGDPYSSNLNTSFYGSLENSRLDSMGDNAEQYQNTIFQMSDGVMESNTTSSNDPSNNMDLMSLQSLINLKNNYVFIKNVGKDVNDKLNIPAYFLEALLLIIIIIITLAIISALRGTGKL